MAVFRRAVYRVWIFVQHRAAELERPPLLQLQSRYTDFDDDFGGAAADLGGPGTCCDAAFQTYPSSCDACILHFRIISQLLPVPTAKRWRGQMRLSWCCGGDSNRNS